MGTTRISVVLFLGIFTCVPFVRGVVQDLVLDVYPYVQVGQYATYNCRSSSAEEGDPVFIWTIRRRNDRTEIIADNLQEIKYDNKNSTTDGEAESKVEFLVDSSYIGENLWCSAREKSQTGAVTTFPGIPAQISIGAQPPRGGLGQLCNFDGSCDSNALTCTQLNNRATVSCECSAGYAESGGSCIATGQVELGQVCGSSSQCRPDNSICNSLTTTCQCAQGYLSSGGECYLQNVPLDQSCAISGQQCSTVFSVCDSFTRICVCNSNGYYRLVDGNGTPQCRQKGTVGQGSSSCVVGYDSCLQANAVCDSGQCICSGTLVFDANLNQCIAPTNVGLDDICDDQIATCTVQNSICRITFPRVCECTANYYAFLGSCQLKGNLGEGCNVNYDSCLTGNAVCTNGVCACDTGFVRQGSVCTPIVNVGLGEQCDSSTRVCNVLNSVCGSGPGSLSTCQCISGYFEDNNNCVQSGGIGAICSTTQSGSCLTINSECVRDGNQNRCTCIQGYQYAQATETCDLPSLGNPCVPNIGCKQTATGSTTTNPVCTNQGGNNYVCACPTNYYGLNGVQCVYASQVGDECAILDLASCLDPNAQCSSVTSPPTCACIDGFTHNVNTRGCDLPSIGEPCRTNVGCQATAVDATMTNPQCSAGFCSCTSQYYSYDGKCIQKHSLGQTCYAAVSEACSDTLADCTSLGLLVTCQCRSPYVNSNGVCTGESGQFCGPTREATTTGVSDPAGITSTPDVRVGNTCYEVDMFNSETMACQDSKKSSAVQHGRWEKLVNGAWTDVGQQTESYINGDAATPSVTVSNAQPGYTGQYRCVLCYGTGQTRCTYSETVQLYVIGTALTSATASMSPTSPQKGGTVTFTCATVPADVATRYRWYRNGQEINVITDVYTINNVQPNQDGSYHCEASNTYGTVSSLGNPIVLSVRYLPEGPRVGETEDVFGNLASDPIRIQCVVTANPAVQTYYFYDNANNLLQSDSRRTFDIDNEQGYGTYSCEAQNSVGRSGKQFFNVQEQSTPGVGAATEDSGLSTGTIVAIVLGIIFLLLLILIIIVCCCSYGWCRKKEKVEPQVVPQVAAKPYVIRPMMSASSTVSRKDVGVLVKGHDFPEPEERYTPSPRYYLKPATNGGPIISMYDDKYSQPRPLQLPALDTQYLYVDDDEPKRRRHRRKKHRHERRDKSPRQTYYEADDSENKYAEVLDAKSDDLVVVPGKQNYFE